MGSYFSFEIDRVLILSLVSLFLLATFFTNSSFVILSALLFLPLLDKRYGFSVFYKQKKRMVYYVAYLLIMVLILIIKPDVLKSLLVNIFLVALPEEWFFRGYLLTQLQALKPANNIRANILSSIAFSILHAITRGPLIATWVFIPSLMFGWLYQKTHDLFLCIFIHAISNIFFTLFAEKYFPLYL